MTKPATPLPWQAVMHGLAPYSDIVSGSRQITAAGDEDAAYIVQACNAYPQLVADRAELIETLKYVLVESSSCRNVIRNLLRDLGEAQS